MDDLGNFPFSDFGVEGLGDFDMTSNLTYEQMCVIDGWDGMNMLGLDLEQPIVEEPTVQEPVVE